MLTQRNRLSNQTAVFLVMTTLFVIYEVVACLGAFVLDLKGASVDAAKFHELATAWAADPSYTINIGVHFYIQLLGTLYYIFGSHQLIGTQLSIVAMLFAAYKLHRFLRKQGVARTSLLILLIFLWPSLLPRAGTTMREPLMILATIYLVTELAYFIQKGLVGNFFKAILGGVVLFLLHKATGLITVMVLGYACAYTTLLARNSFKSRLYLFSGVIAITLLLTIFITMFADLREMRVFSALLQGDVGNLDVMLDMKYEKATAVSRAAYNAPISFSDPVQFVVSMVVSAWHFTFEPFPNRITTILDLYAFIEVVFRSCFIVYILAHWRLLTKSHRFMFASFWIVTFVWASGTTNYGTASRHQLTGFWILVVLYGLIRAAKHNRRLSNCKEVIS